MLVPLILSQSTGQPAVQPPPPVGLPWELLRRTFADYLSHTGTVTGRAISENVVKIGIVSKATRIASSVTSIYARTLSHLYIESVEIQTVARAFRTVNSVAGYRSRGIYRHSLGKRLRKRAGRKFDYE